jgi:uncharacterized protein (TIGR03066 family)
MQAARALVIACLTLILAAAQAFADAKADAQKALRGKWEATQKMGNVEVNLLLTFEKDGKLSMKMTGGGRTFNLDGKYKIIDENNMEVTITFMGQTKTEKSKFKVKGDRLELTSRDPNNKESTQKFTRAK